MRTVYVNEIMLADREVVRGFIVVNKTIIENLKTMFSEVEQGNIKRLMLTEPTKSEGCHFFSKFCQFVVYFNYNATKVQIGNSLVTMGITIEVLYFGTSPNVNDTFDYMLKLRKSGWGEESRDAILELAYQIKKEKYESHFEIAELKIKDPWNALASFL